MQRHQEREHGGKTSINESPPKQPVADDSKSKPVTRRPRREKLQEKIAAQEKLLDELKRSLSTLPDIAEESTDTPVSESKLNMTELAADAGAGIGAGCAQVSVTVSMQVEPAKADDDDEEITPEKENALSSGSATDVVSSNGKTKTNRKITSYFTVVGQQAEI